jgi:hemerythrin-like metal-binding protein
MIPPDHGTWNKCLYRGLFQNQPYLGKSSLHFYYLRRKIMEYVWDKSFETGHAMIDTQHKQLFAALNDLIETCRLGKRAEELEKNLNFLNDYTIKHFFDEEQVQQKYHYPDYENHKKIHDNFKATVRDLKVKMIMKGASNELIQEVREKIGNWLITHIKGQDVKIGAYIKAQEVKA